MSGECPLFPLRTVLFPEGPLPLRIFEPRYLKMISQSVSEQTPFGVVLIEDGEETGPAVYADIGTLAEIVDWYQGSDGLLGVTARGTRRFRIDERSVDAGGLNRATMTLLDEPDTVALPAEYTMLADILRDVLDDLGRLYRDAERRYDDAGWVGCRLAEILPISPKEKQRCLVEDDPIRRLRFLAGLVKTSD